MKSKLLKSLLLLMVFAISIQLQAQTQSPQKALSFDGVNDYVSGATGISTSLTAFTIEAWVYHNTLSAVVQRYITINPEVVVLRYDGTIYGGTNALHFYLKKANGSLVGFLVENVLTTGTWMHIAGTYDGTTMKLYLNGTLIKSASPGGGLYPPSGGYSFSSGGSEAFNGKMDEVSVWNYARSMSDIREDMYRTAPLANANLKNYWQFNNGSGTTLTDLKGTATGTLNNMTNSNWVASTIPFAAGAVNTQIVNATGTKTFTGTSLVANFTAKSGIDTIVASRIDTLPNVSPAGVPTVFNSQYWVVKRFGTGTFTSNLTFTLSEDLTATDESLPANISLYARADNSDAGWTSLATATSVNAANNTATFNGISGFSQFIVVRNCTPPTISSQSTASQTQPENCSFYPITVTATGTNLTYQWYSNASASNSGGTSLGSGNGAQTYSYTPPGKAAGTLYYYCVVSGCGPSQTSAVSGAFISTSVTAPAGSGTVADPYRIASLDNLCWLQAPANSSYWTSNFIQTADINAAPCKNWNGGVGFTPIGSSNSFTGKYNGKGHIVDSIFIRTTGNYAGFFGQIYQSTIDSLNLTNVSIIGVGHVGALVGSVQSSSTISHCSSSGSVTVSSDFSSKKVGGLIGYVLDGSPVIQYCYSSAEVNDIGLYYYLYKGGLIGRFLNGTLIQCYARGLVSAPAGTTTGYAGGLVGMSIYADQCYWDNQTSGQTSGGTQIGSGTWNLYGKSTVEMKTQSTFVGWDFTNNWYISANANNGYPCFYYALVLSTQAVSNVTNFTATANGTIVRNGTFNITSYGVCYNTTGTPTIADTKVNLGAAPYCCGAYTANLTGLHQGTTYYLRAFAINERDTVYGEQQSFTTTNVTQASTCLFNGDQYNYISIPNNSSLQLTNNYSIEVWLKPGVAVSTNRIIVSKGYNAGGYTLLSNGSGNQRGLIFDGMATADNILTQNQWCHVAAVNDNGTRHLYLNGVEMPLTGTPASVTANTQPLYLSNYDNGGPSNVFRGYIEEVRLWNTAMTYSQIRENMHLPLTGSETGLVSYWQFDEGQPPTVYDKKGVNNGTWYASVINQYKTSTIPFGSGYSNTQVVSTTGTTTFTNTGLAINFTTKSGSDIIVVTRIDSFPNVNPTEVDAVFDRQYWAVHKYGLGNYTANLTFTINENFTASDELQPGKIDLYTRTNATDDNWTYLASASSVSATNHQVTFNGLNNIVNPSENDPNIVKYLGQYIIVREQCQVNIPDVNFKTALLAIPGLDANSDGKIQCTEATAFTGDIDVNAKTIADMTGIEAFSNITKLYCSNNNLTSLNISALTLLTDLDCSYNQLTALNITSNTALVNFSCANNLLTSLNVSGLASLNYLVCRYNQLTSLDVSSNSALIGLQCNNNSLTGLNVSGLTSLSNINCGVNQLTNLDFSTNTGITKLGCDYNSLTSLNVKNGHNTNMSGSNFYAANNPGLSCIQVDNATWSTTNWIHKDAGASYSTDCSCINPAISSQSTATQTQCVNGAFTPITVTATGTNLMYQWYSNTTATTSGGTTIGTNSNSYTPLATIIGTLYYYCEVSGDCGTLQTSAISGAFIVNPAIEISSQSTPAQTQCLNGTFNAINVTATGTNLTYQWYSNATAGNTGGTTLGSANGANTNSYTPQATSVGTLYYYCVVNGDCGTAQTSAVSGAFIVNPATAISSQSTATQTQTLNGTFTPITVTATGTNLIYQWYSNGTASNTGGTSLGTGNGANTNSYTPQATTVGTLYYYCVVTGSCGTTQTTAVSGAFITSSSQTFVKQGAGVTLIIHGWNPDGSQPSWMQPMANAIIARSGGVGQIGTITVSG
ncbi:MAG: LamG-like jellyroll fold domain-containing protein, partial [Bacteroidales bacterium]